MVFKRRKKLPLSQRLQGFFYPRTGWRRAVEYIGHRIRRLPDTPHNIAIGISCGVFVSFSPLFGLHMILAVFFAMILRGNVIAAFFGTFIGNPVTYPFIVPAVLKLGLVILGTGSAQVETVMGQDNTKLASEGEWQVVKSIFGFGSGPLQGNSGFFNDIFLPFLVGGAIIGLIAAVAAYFIMRPLVMAYKTRHRERLKARALKRAAARKQEQSTAKSA